MGLVPETWKFQPYFKLGAGLLYMTLHTREQSTQFNFTEQCALGIHYYFTKNTAFTLEGRWRHLSNSGIKHPNHGINTCFINTGVSYKF
jgi:predicted porin